MLIFNKKERSAKIVEVINTNLSSKDKCIVEMDRCLVDLENQINGLNVELAKAKEIIEVSFTTGFNKG